MAEARQQVEDLPELRALVGSEGSAELMLGFLIEWAARSTQLHEPGERVLVIASRRCASLGELEVGRSLMRVASEAIEGYRRLAADTRMLVELWNRERRPQRQLTALLMQPKSAAILRLQAQQESLVGSSRPWAQLAAMYEIEALLGAVAERVRGRARELLGDEVLPCLSSFEALVAPRMQLREIMAAFLEASPERAAAMVEVGRDALQLYAEFLLECHAAVRDPGSPGSSRRALM